MVHVSHFAGHLCLGSARNPYNAHGSNTEYTLEDSLLHVKKKKNLLFTDF